MNPDDLLFSAVRTVHIGCALLLVAFPVFAVFHWKPVPADRDRHDAFCRTTLLGLSVVLVVEIASGAAWLWLVAAQMCEEAAGGGLSWTDLGTMVTETRFGLLWIVRGLIALMLGSLLAAIAGGRSVKPGAAVLAIWLSLALGCALLGSLAWAGHAASGVRWQAWHLTVDIVHLLSGAVWPIGLVPLALFLTRREAGGLGEADREVVRRFSQASFVAVLALVASGVANSWLMLPSWEALFATLWGRLLLVKAGIVVAMLAMGAVNRYCFVPALATEATPRLARTIAVESGLSVAVLLIVGAMGTTAPGS